ncbi:hypothetical protein CAOG_02645 [Capsaspora owczarzaki ATCC 30864]|uniref:Uncharacterized protein n=1 Tax=Capsaspora owczarzaki (strain ATCC 30864) TaxID=595528 RepID=A0A0D2VMU3_CAPO3|nr:hypothetical protein CAOG_02645 [Capsaspora owczarzaki ATCC 30864]KJE91517.1 hypothetical protein CAOG_002645 [Capsaspora owczarzaki ATCC 30864]|eukprot:XP_004349395.1 hypothetical protein CAOG_02645 [Capsaspora owczarzaki ATCC 30864]
MRSLFASAAFAPATVLKHIPRIAFPARRMPDGSAMYPINASIFAKQAVTIPNSAAGQANSSSRYRSLASYVPYTAASLLRQRRHALTQEEIRIVESGGAFP